MKSPDLHAAVADIKALHSRKYQVMKLTTDLHLVAAFYSYMKNLLSHQQILLRTLNR